MVSKPQRTIGIDGSLLARRGVSVLRQMSTAVGLMDQMAELMVSTLTPISAKVACSR
jgi:hypothetical protein